MRKVYKKLTQEEKQEGIIFSSQLIPSDTIHKVYKNDDDKDKTIDRLLDDSFFNNSHFKYNLIKQ